MSRDAVSGAEPVGSTLVPIRQFLGAPQGGGQEAGGPPCHRCTARCCRYLAVQIDRPVTPRDHDQIRWYLLHENVVVWVQDGEWHLEVRAPCRHLLPDNRCAIYDRRPDLCREYGWPEGTCEFFEEDLQFDLFFDSAESFEAWSRVQLEKRERRLARRRERARAERQRRRADRASA